MLAQMRRETRKCLQEDQKDLIRVFVKKVAVDDWYPFYKKKPQKKPLNF
ncbi:hypothetical protein N9A45_00660 [bacterium]|nr:hypothetical protein [bacterium]